jgi:hypothetical protein
MAGVDRREIEGNIVLASKVRPDAVDVSPSAQPPRPNGFYNRLFAPLSPPETGEEKIKIFPWRRAIPLALASKTWAKLDLTVPPPGLAPQRFSNLSLVEFNSNCDLATICRIELEITRKSTDGCTLSGNPRVAPTLLRL